MYDTNFWLKVYFEMSLYHTSVSYLTWSFTKYSHSSSSWRKEIGHGEWPSIVLSTNLIEYPSTTYLLLQVNSTHLNRHVSILTLVPVLFCRTDCTYPFPSSACKVLRIWNHVLFMTQLLHFVLCLKNKFTNAETDRMNVHERHHAQQIFAGFSMNLWFLVYMLCRVA